MDSGRESEVLRAAADRRVFLNCGVWVGIVCGCQSRDWPKFAVVDYQEETKGGDAEMAFELKWFADGIFKFSLKLNLSINSFESLFR